MDVYFPVSRTEILHEDAENRLEAYAGSAERILVVDDVELQRTIAQAILAKLGYDVHTVSSGEEAVQYLKHESADLVLLDMIMKPGMDGLDPFKQILDIRSDQKTILASGYSETDRVKEALRLGAGAYLKKPYSLKKMAEVIRKELDK